MLTITYAVFIILHSSTVSGTLKCHQCSGWQGHNYAPGLIQASSCDNLNNQCQSQHFCVKKIDPIVPSKGYSTYNSDCWQSAQIQIAPSNVSTIVSGQCYPFTDSANPPKRWTYCFCNDADYCNGAYSNNIWTLTVSKVVALLVTSLCSHRVNNV